MAELVPRLSGWDFVDEVHGVDSTRAWTSPNVPGHETRISAMRHQNSVFHSVLKHVPWAEFDRLVGIHGADARVRRLTTKSQLTALLYGQLSGAASLREIVTGLESHAARLYHLGAAPVRRSTLSEANMSRPHAVFGELLGAMLKQVNRGLRRKLAETTYLIDATGVRLSELSAGWARFSSGVCGAKVHVIYDADADCPIYAAVSAAKVNDITVAQQNADRAGCHLCLRSRLLRLHLVGQARRRPVPDRHPVQSQHPTRARQAAPGAGGQQYPLRPDRLPAAPPSQEPPQPHAGCRAGSAGGERDGQGAAHPL